MFSQRNSFLAKKIFLFYLIISNSIINSGITIFPDHYEHDDEIFTTSQVNGITNERFYYSLGYYTDLKVDYISPKYGVTYHPVECIDLAGTAPDYKPVYSNNDRTSFFQDINGKAIRYPDSTRTGLNKIEETKLFQNTMGGRNIKCPSPFSLFHNYPNPFFVLEC